MNTFDKTKPVAIGSDHAGYEYKTVLADMLREAGYTVKDFGTNSPDSVDYPDFAHPVSSAVENGEAEWGVLVCGSANGVAITANKHQGIRAAIAWQEDIAQLARQHNNANIICIPARFIPTPEAEAIVNAFATTPFEGGRHATRVGKMACI
ncbi:ribose 5-phosphate isomerase B [Paracnuella aquatica]|uniref:ribose 5-phosphate isomerase B n=1 Tax=Paracnuella aquatica TaxID=2268757 RepID=UPI000DEFB236|nr:ribose 5-phosphate isomerase B [Paracnuella aquatica]RPD46010.1 ribose 5-phosphate isomerase B [Paracnuella aquatica]